MQEEIRESTSIKIKPSIWKKAKLQAICDDIELSVFVEQAVSFWIKCRNNGLKKGKTKEADGLS